MTRALLLAVGVLAIIACSAPDDSARVDADVGDKTTFLPVASALGRRCGTSDCHGTTHRNFRIYGYGALRLQPGDQPDLPVTTTQAESDATYDAFVSLEPELTRQVVLAHGAGVDGLTVIRKGRGDESHKGGALIVRGDDADLCVVGWLSGTANPDACARVLTEP